MNNETLEKHFDLAFSAPNGVQKLRELILTFAMQGKLVPQDPSDQPASELLKEIEAEKQKLVMEGKIKNFTPLSKINKDETPYSLPDGWEWVRLGDIVISITGGGTPSKNNSTYWNGNIPWASVKDLNVDTYIESTIDHITEEGLRGSSSNLIPKGSIIVCTRMGLGKIAINKVDIAINQDLKALNVSLNVDKMFVFKKYRDYKIKGKGVTVHGIRQDELLNFLFPLPPLAEQKRIVAKIDRLMAQCDELENLGSDRNQKRITIHTAAIDRLLAAQADSDFSTAWDFIQQHFGELYSVKENVAELRKAILQLAVMGKLVPQDPNDEAVETLLSRIHSEREKLKLSNTNHVSQPPKLLEFTIPESWIWRCLNDILVFGPTNGFSPKAVDYETPVRSLTLSATTSGKFKGEYSKFISQTIPSDSTLWLRDGDILVQRGNTLEYVGVSAVYQGEPNHFIYPDLMMKLRVSSEIDTSFIHIAMSSEPSRNFLRCRASGTSGTMPKINQTTLRSLPIPIPPLAEQQRIVAKVEQLLALCDELEQQIDAATDKRTELLKALMAQV
jgi:type I restriction enzyme, S subunit